MEKMILSIQLRTKKLRVKKYLVILFMCIGTVSCSQAQSITADSLLIGTWRGTSICQIRPSACNDEICAYHITKGEGAGIYHMVMNKVVNGVETDMGVSDYIYKESDHSLYTYIEKYKVTVQFTVNGKTMDGTLTSNGKLYRVIKLKKDG